MRKIRLLGVTTLLTILLMPLVAKADSSKHKLLEKQLKIKKIPLQGIPDQRALRVVIEPKARCFLGDIDIMLRELRQGDPGTRLQISIEPIYPNSAGLAPSVRNVHRAEPIGDGKVQLWIPVPNVSSPTLLGLFLCKNSGDAEGCADKDIQPYDQLSNQFAVVVDQKRQKGYLLNPPSVGQGAIDRVLFFRPLVIDQDSARFSELLMAAGDYDRLDTYFSRLLQTDSLYQENFGRMRFLGQALGSLPLEFSGEGVTVALPYYNRKKCTGSP